MPQPTEFRWNWWNQEHATKHGVTVAEAEHVVRWGRSRNVGHDKRMVEGRGVGDRLVRVVFVIDEDGRTAYIIHAMPLTTRRRRKKR